MKGGKWRWKRNKEIQEMFILRALEKKGVFTQNIRADSAWDWGGGKGGLKKEGVRRKNKILRAGHKSVKGRGVFPFVRLVR